MEYVEGRSLAGQLPVSPARALEIAREVCAAVGCAHRHGLVHRDLKPANILVDRVGALKVSDFGIAAFAPNGDESVPTESVARSVAGTLAYMAPEALLGAAPDPRMDVYSLGALFYELVEGHPPQGYFEPPAPFERVLKKALSADPSQRYADADEMLEDLALPRPAPIRGGALPFPEKVLAVATALFVAAGLAGIFHEAVVRAASSVAQTGGWGDFWAAMLFLAVGLVSTRLLLRRWRTLGLVSDGGIEGVPQTTAALRLAGVAVFLGGWRAVLALPSSPASWSMVLFRGAQAGGLVACVWGLLESRRRRDQTDEPFLWLALGLVACSFALELAPVAAVLRALRLALG
jgi:serine/threonine-protein kinase